MTLRHHVTPPRAGQPARKRAKSLISRKGKKHPHKGHKGSHRKKK